ncbi:unnamed protein product [Discosporangium mesarthrocarpum]
MGPGFDGKICIWPVIETAKPKHSSKSRAPGDMKFKPVTTDGEQYKQMIKQVIPAIKARMPEASTHTIWIQLDAAKTHARNGVIAASWGKLIPETQPPNSPDLNVLDLGFFHSIQQLRDNFGVTNVGDLVEATIEALITTPGRPWNGSGTAFCCLW